jgi:hypothetical protein
VKSEKYMSVHTCIENIGGIEILTVHALDARELGRDFQALMNLRRLPIPMNALATSTRMIQAIYSKDIS